MKKKTYRVTADVWIYPGPPAGGGQWHFVSLGKKESADIKAEQAGKPKRGWGSVPVDAERKEL